MVVLAEAAPERRNRDQIADAQAIPSKYLEAILSTLRNGGLVRSHRGKIGGFTLARSAGEVTIADIARVVDGPLTLVQGARPESVSYDDGLEPLTSVWVAVRASLRSVLESVTLADVVEGSLPESVRSLIDSEDAWTAH